MRRSTDLRKSAVRGSVEDRSKFFDNNASSYVEYQVPDDKVYRYKPERGSMIENNLVDMSEDNMYRYKPETPADDLVISVVDN